MPLFRSYHIDNFNDKTRGNSRKASQNDIKLVPNWLENAIDKKFEPSKGNTNQNIFTDTAILYEIAGIKYQAEPFNDFWSDFEDHEIMLG